MIKAGDLSSKLALDANSLNNLKQASKDSSPEAIKGVATQFEALFVNMMLKSMRDATPQDGVFDNEQSRAFTSMLDQQLSQNIASRGIGLADIMARQLSKTGNGPSAASDAAAAAGKSGDKAAEPATKTGSGMLAAPLRAAASAVENVTAKIKHGLSGAALAFHQQVAAHAEIARRASGIPASFMIGQAALESGWGKREIKGTDGTASHNLFGIKANAGWHGKTVEATTTEYINGVPQKRIEKFRAYDSYADSFKDFAQLIANSPRYENAMANLDDVGGYAHAIQDAGYATDPNYASKLISVVRQVAVS
jgi:flagellar protein FlgJ